jgi:putative ABC transport system ATP-binding protein
MRNKDNIQIRNINKSFPIGGKRKNKVLKDVNLEIQEGEFITIFGPSGCGKSTLLHTIMGIERPDSGKVQILGKSIWDMNADQRADFRKQNIGVVFQQQNWIKSLSVLENVALSTQLLGYNQQESLQKAHEAIQKMNMTRFENFVPTELSSGEQQKIGLARALVSNPKIVIADEPTGNLDTENGDEILRKLKKLAKEGTTVILVTHNPEHLGYSDTVAIMKDGYLIEKIQGGKDIYKKIKEKLEKSDMQESGYIVMEKDFKKEDDSEKDYPEESLWEKIRIFFFLIFTFFIESGVLMATKILSKTSPEKAENLRMKTSLFVHNLENGSKETKSISSIDLTELSFKNLLYKRFRTVVTIAGVALGTGFVILLLSLGYGLERLVVEQITEAKDLNQMDVYPKVGSQLSLDDNLIDKIESLSGIVTIYKIKNVAGRVDYLGSTSDLVVYGIDDGYLESTKVRKLAGEYFNEKSVLPEIIVNKEYVNLFGLKEEEIIGEELEVVIIEKNPEEEMENNLLKGIVISVVEDEFPPVAYVKLNELNEFTTEDYSQATVVVSGENSLKKVRGEVEALGLETFSVMDTIEEVETLFNYIRYALLIFGIMAFTIAFLGMINTLVVSLLERTREIGLMKIIGMKRNEVRALFITESMFIGFLGGILGILFGYFAGYVVSFIVYLFSMSRGVGYIQISFIPLSLIILVILSTTLLGFFTGLYPAKRAVKMDPLDALRYE